MGLSIKYAILIILILMLSGCSGGESNTTTTNIAEKTLIETITPSTQIEIPPVTQSNISLSGKITYDFVPTDEHGLDFNATVQKPIRAIKVDLLDMNEKVLQTTLTNTKGEYYFEHIPANSQVLLQFYALMPTWQVTILDNTNNNAIYVLRSSPIHVGTQNIEHDYNAPSGWHNGYSNKRVRSAAPFAILDTIYQSIQTVLNTENNISFAPLRVYWSIHNKAISCGETENISEGDILTTYYKHTNDNKHQLYILGDANSDTDEYDSHVIAHEWGHYYENYFSRTDSIGGIHNGEQLLDIRVAFSEGWSNAFSAIALKNPLYYDTAFTRKQQNVYKVNIDTAQGTTNRGWFNEASIQRIIYDLWDGNSNQEEGDNLHLGFLPIHQAMHYYQKTTPAFTSLFTFISALKKIKPDAINDIDILLANENISTVFDIYGTGRNNKSHTYPYQTVEINHPITTTLTTQYGCNGNNLNNRHYITFHIDETDNYTINIEQIDNTQSNPAFNLYQTKPQFRLIPYGNQFVSSINKMKITLPKGDYLIDLYDFNTPFYDQCSNTNYVSNQFNITIQKENN